MLTEKFYYDSKQGDIVQKHSIWKLSNEQDEEASFVSSTWDQEKLLVTIEVPKSVYIKTVDGQEQIIYNSNMMKLDKIYEIKFNNESWALRKTKKGIEFLKLNTMSREISGQAGVPGYGIGGTYKTMFRAPLILDPCKHTIEETKSRIRKERWIRLFHGQNNGEVSFRLLCIKKEKIILDVK